LLGNYRGINPFLLGRVNVDSRSLA